jgi:L-malate glycosyltransferase
MGPISLHLLQDEGVDVTATPVGFQYAFGAYLVREYLRRGHEVSVVTTIHRLPGPFSWSNGRLSIDAVPTRRGYLFCLDDFRRERRMMREAIARRGPDVLHAQWTYEFAHAAIETGLPCLVTARDSPRQIVEHSPGLYTYYKRWYAGRVLPRIPRLTAVSPYMRDELRAVYRLRCDPEVVPNGIRPEVFAGEVRPPRAGPFTFITVAGWDPRKNPRTLLEAFARLKRRHPDCRLRLAGHGFEPDGPAVRWASGRGLAAGVEFLGHLSHAAVLAELREQADVFVHPTLEESFGSSILEAMSQRVPVVAGSQSGAVPWILDEGRAGLLVDVASADALSQGMERIMDDEGLRSRLATAGFERARGEFSLASVADRYLTLLEGVRGEQGIPPAGRSPCSV